MQRAASSGARVLTVPITDLRELINAVVRSERREEVEKLGHVFGFARAETLSDMRRGKALHLTVRRKKNHEYVIPVFCDPSVKYEVDAVAQTPQNAPTPGETDHSPLTGDDQ